FSRVLFAGLGSAATPGLQRRFPSAGPAPAILAAIVLLIAAQTWVVPRFLEAALGWTIGARILIAGALLAPLGCVMGMALPLGIHALREGGEEALIPYLWGINGVFSVLGSVLATILAVSSGYSTGLLTGLGAYLIAMAMAVWSAFADRHRGTMTYGNREKMRAS